ncbi:MAG: hypothetical protein CVU89_05845 [Firmicutes bacterium HGW-Firmicutes-14]|nr:MAG: hypothetical protein CVU89_05845 [Firmicutes bacterium HGW-Firmicutes-14]
MILEHNECSNTPAHIAGKQFRILVADPGGKLKLARWRLMSDGYRVDYSRDWSVIESLIREEEFHIVLVNIGGHNDFELIKRINYVEKEYEIIGITDPKAKDLSKLVSALGIKITVSRPVDFPVLSAVVRKELEGIKERERKKIVFERFKKTITLPQNIRNLFKSVLELLKTRVIVLDESGEIVFVNDSMSRMLGLKGPGVVGKHFSDVFTDESSDCELKSCVPNSYCPGGCVLHSVLSRTFNEENASHSEVTISMESEEVLRCQAEVYPITDSSGEFIGALVTMDDEAGDTKVSRGLAQSEKLAMVGQLAAGVAHEIKNPLTSVKGFIQLLQHDLDGTPKGEYIDIIITEIDRVNKIVEDFLKLAKPAVSNRKECDLYKLFKDIRVLIDSEAFLKNVEIAENFSEPLPRVHIDPEQITQVIINIIRNSFDAMPKGGTITFQAFNLESESKVCLEISDTGEGMNDETLKRIFKPFFTTKDHGTGLGLAVSQAIMDSHGGRIEMKSNEGIGTTTRLYFPCM